MSWRRAKPILLQWAHPQALTSPVPASQHSPTQHWHVEIRAHMKNCSVLSQVMLEPCTEFLKNDLRRQVTLCMHSIGRCRKHHKMHTQQRVCGSVQAGAPPGGSPTSLKRQGGPGVRAPRPGRSGGPWSSCLEKVSETCL